MKKWICNMCGYTHFENEAPPLCPQCGAPKSQFTGTTTGRGCALSFLAFVALLTVPIIALFSCSPKVTVDNSTVPSLDLNRYLGKWFEIARIDHRFERGMEQCTAVYERQEDGMLKVTNRGKKRGEWSTTVGKGKLTNVPGVLRVSFFGPFYADYRVLKLAPDYSYALVGGGSDDYLWILSRTPQLNDDARRRIVSDAHSRGYNTERLIWVKQDEADGE